MKKFWSYITNEKYAIGCTGGTVYVYDSEGRELVKFKDMRYAYVPLFNPVRNEFVVKSTEGRLAYYSLDELKLIKKFRFSKIDGAQDEGFCFSKDGKYLYNLETHIVSTNTGLTVYDINDFSIVRTFEIEDERLFFTQIQCDNETGEIYLLGIKRNDLHIADFQNVYFAAKLGEYELEDIVYISEEVYRYYSWCIALEMTGFSEKAFEWWIDASERNKYKSVKIKELIEQYDFKKHECLLNEHKALLDLSYYKVPEEAFLYDDWQQKLQPVNLQDNWHAICIGDTEYKAGRSIGAHFDCIGELIWQLKKPDEKLVFRAKLSRWKNKYHEARILSAIEADEELREYLGGKHLFIYEAENGINKIVTVTPGEMIECYYRKEIERDVESVFSKWAVKTEYYKYELDE